MRRATVAVAIVMAASTLSSPGLTGTPRAEALVVTGGGAARFDAVNCITLYSGGAVLTLGERRLEGETLVLYARKREAPGAVTTPRKGWVTLRSECARPHQAHAHRNASFRDASGVREADHAFYDLETGAVRFHSEPGGSE